MDTDAAADEDADEVDLLKETVDYSPRYVNGLIRCPTQWPFSFRTRHPNPHHAEREAEQISQGRALRNKDALLCPSFGTGATDSTAKGPHRGSSSPAAITTTCACCLRKSNTPSANRPTRGSGTRSTSFSEVEEAQESRRHWGVLRCDAIQAPASRRKRERSGHG
jgi:hypothetical protein